MKHGSVLTKLYEVDKYQCVSKTNIAEIEMIIESVFYHIGRFDFNNGILFQLWGKH